jgi:hypothetical protein
MLCHEGAEEDEEEEDAAVGSSLDEHRLSDSDSSSVLPKMPSLSQRMASGISRADLSKRGESSHNIFRL